MAFALSQYALQPLYADLLPTALSRLPMAVSIYDNEANIAFANDAYLQLWNLSAELMQPQNTQRRLALQLDMLEPGYEELFTGVGEASSESQSIRFRDGRRFELVSSYFVSNIGQPFRVKMWLDESAYEQATQAVSERLSLFRSLTDLLPDQLFFKDSELRYTEVNQAFIEHHSLDSVESIVGLTDATLLTQDYARRNEAEERHILETGKPLIADLREEVRLSGDTVWHQTTKLPFYGASGAIEGIFGFSVDVTDQRRNEQLIWRQANYDHLTQLPNRRLLAERWHSAWQAHLRDQRGIGLILVNLDQFKGINDTYGFQSGEQLLVSVAQRLRTCTRGKDSIARLNADEFAILATDIKNEDDLSVVVRKVQSQFDEPYMLAATPVTVSASVGIALAPDDGAGLDDLMMHAEHAMHEAKRLGGKSWIRYTPALHASVSEKFSLANDLRYAVKNQEFSLNFQPIVDLQADLEWVKVEALIRWHHIRRGWVSPAEFIPVAEQNGLIVEIGEWVFNEAVERLAEIKSATGLDLRVSVNVSPLQLKSEKFDPQRWLAKLTSLGLVAGNLIVEITEGMFLDPDPRVLDHLDRFAQLGVKVSLDDFGTGYASVSFLENFKVDVLKLDRAFVQDAEKTPKRRILAEAIINMASALELEVVAEGIETQAQSDWLKAAGCEYGQGYYYAKPLTPGKLQQQLLERIAMANQ